MQLDLNLVLQGHYHAHIRGAGLAVNPRIGVVVVGPRSHDKGVDAIDLLGEAIYYFILCIDSNARVKWLFK